MLFASQATAQSSKQYQGYATIERIEGLDELRFVGRRLDDLGPDRIERLAFIIVAAAGDRETRAFRRNYLELRHFLLPI